MLPALGCMFVLASLSGRLFYGFGDCRALLAPVAGNFRCSTDKFRQNS